MKKEKIIFKTLKLPESLHDKIEVAAKKENDGNFHGYLIDRLKKLFGVK